MFHMGMVDVLEETTCAWTVQHYSLRSLLCLICWWSYIDGVTAMPPDDYARRFTHFMEMAEASSHFSSSSTAGPAGAKCKVPSVRRLPKRRPYLFN